MQRGDPYQKNFEIFFCHQYLIHGVFSDPFLTLNRMVIFLRRLQIKFGRYLHFFKNRLLNLVLTKKAYNI
jgi:hypothetical protein